ncbi:MAG: hypothetical protein ABIT71_19245 [Vicinamibacteraceae bacterium]
MLKILVRAMLVLAMASPAAAQAVRTVPLNANDLAYSPLTGRLYASVAASNSVVEIDPIAGTIGTSIPVGSTPNRLAISDTGEYLYVGLDGLPGVVRVHLPSRTVGTPFTLGLPHPSQGPRRAHRLAVLPGNPDAVAVARRFSGPSPIPAGVAVYDLGVPRALETPINDSGSSIAFGASAARLYGFQNETTGFRFSRMDVTPSGVTIVENTQDLISGFNADIEYVGGRLFATSGRVIDPEARTIVTTLPNVGSAISAVEATASAIFYLSVTGNAWQLRAFDPTSLTLVAEGPIPGGFGLPLSLVAAGADMLAVATGTADVYLIRPSLVPAAPPILTIATPTTGTTLVAESATITLAGTAADANGTVTSVHWATTRGYSGVANGTTEWTAGDIPLALGSNVIAVTATDDTGQTSVDSLDVTVTGFSSFLAEGATGSFFDYDLALANPSMVSVDAAISFFTQGGATVTQTMTLPAQSRRTIRVDEVPGLADTTMSTSVRTTTAPIVVERTMRWGQTPDAQYGAHGDKATAGSARRWYFAEGSQGFFFTYLLLANPGNTANTATIDWLVEGAASVQRTVQLPPASRTTIDAGADAALVGRSFGIVVNFSEPAVAERAMYFGTPPDVLFKAGHDSAGVTTPSTQWFLAEGATGPFFETFILLANPNPQAVDVNLRFITQTGAEVTRTVTVFGLARLTVNLEALTPAAPELANAAVSTIVTAAQPIVAERAQYWPGGGADWYEAHNSFGSVAAARKWGLAEGRVGNPPGIPPASYQTYVLLANPGTVPAAVTITFLRESGAPVVRTFAVAAGTRRNVAVAGAGSMVPELVDEHFGALIESDQPIVVERALYGNAGTQVFGLGTNATATPLP